MSGVILCVLQGWENECLDKVDTNAEIDREYFSMSLSKKESRSALVRV